MLQTKCYIISIVEKDKNLHNILLLILKKKKNIVTKSGNMEMLMSVLMLVRK